MTLTAAYQDLRAEIDRLEAEKAYEQYYASLAAAEQPGPAMEPSGYTASGSGAAGFPAQGGGATWEESAWIPEEWEPEENYQQQ